MSINWVEQQWKTPAIEKAEWVSDSNTNVRRLIFVDGSMMYLKKMNSEESILRVLNIYDALHHHGVRIPKIFVAGSGKRWAVNEGELFMLYNELKGTVNNELNLQNGALYGQGLAMLHEALRHIDPEKHSHMDLVQQLSDWAIPQTKESAEQLGMKDELCQLVDLMTETQLSRIDQLPRQLIHRDPHPGNMVYGEDGVVGFLDFDISVTATRLFDLCYLCTSQWMTAYSKPHEQIKWVELIRELRKGYERVITLISPERTSAFFVMCSIQMIFVSYWHSQKKDEMSKENLKALIELIRLKSSIDDAFKSM